MRLAPVFILCIMLCVFAVTNISFAQEVANSNGQGVVQTTNNNGTTSSSLEDCDPDKDIMLNTNIPFIGRCIKKDPNAQLGPQSTIGNAFPKLMGGLIRVVMSAVVIVGFLAILVGGFMVAAQGAAQTKEKGMNLIKLAVAGLILVGLSGVILNLINPNFFKTTTGGLVAPVLQSLQ